jgi:hypothetical protein
LYPAVLNILGLEFINRVSEHSLKEARFWGIPICIVLTLFGTVKSNDSRIGKIEKTVFTFVIAIVVMFFMIMGKLTIMCDWTNKEVLFISKEKDKLKIIKRGCICRAVNNGLPIVKNFKVQESFKYFIKVTEINIEEIDESKWIKIE